MKKHRVSNTNGRDKPVLRTRRIARMSALREPYDPMADDTDFARRMRASYERLRADPAAWAEWMEECASIDPLLVPQEYWEERERRRSTAQQEEKQKPST
jgi:hypothetical protein